MLRSDDHKVVQTHKTNFECNLVVQISHRSCHDCAHYFSCDLAYSSSIKGFLSDFILLVWCWLQRAWCWLRMGGDVPNSEFVRNVFLVVGGIFALIIAWWRSRIANSHQKTANDQLETDARARLDERFQKGAEMLGDNKLFIRVSGVTTLAQLSEDHPKEFHVQVVNVLGKSLNIQMVK